MSAIVYTTAGGRRFHFDRRCRALESGRDLFGWLWNGSGPVYPLGARSNLGAALLGYTACRVCVPPEFALPATGETYGHEPVTETGYYGDELVCARCDRIGAAPYLSARWPCTSAVVLGLVPRCPDCEHDDRIDALGAAL